MVNKWNINFQTLCMCVHCFHQLRVCIAYAYVFKVCVVKGKKKKNKKNKLEARFIYSALNKNKK